MTYEPNPARRDAWNTLWRTICGRIAAQEVIACQHCRANEDGDLLIGQPALASEVRVSVCPSCRAPLEPEDIVAVGIAPTNPRDAA